MKIPQRFLEDDLRGVHYAASTFLATTVLWFIVTVVGDSNPIWAISSMVATSDPQLKQSLATFHGRIVNTLLGCAVGMTFVALGHTDWQLPAAMALAVIASSYFVRVPTMWRQAPITAAIVVAANLHQHDTLGALESGGMRVGEVLFGCIVGIGVAWLLSKLCPCPRPARWRRADRRAANFARRYHAAALARPTQGAPGTPAGSAIRVGAAACARQPPGAAHAGRPDPSGTMS